jgi:recombination protein RecR
VEKARVFMGKYHVLGGVISPLDGIGPDRLNIKSLLKRIGEEGIKEVIVATDSDTSGEVTALYLAKILTPLDIRVSRLAYGLPMGASLEYADEVTISRAIEGRRDIGSTPSN